MRANKPKFYKQLSKEYPDLSYSEISRKEGERFFARAKSWAKDWDDVLGYIGTHECDILAHCVSEYDSDVSLQKFRDELDRIDEYVEEERANRDASQCVIDGVDDVVEGNFVSLEELLETHDSDDEKQANTDSYTLRDIDFESNTATVEFEPEETGPRLRFSNAARELVRAGYSQDRLEEVISNVFEQEDGGEQ